MLSAEVPLDAYLEMTSSWSKSTVATPAESYPRFLRIARPCSSRPRYTSSRGPFNERNGEVVHLAGGDTSVSYIVMLDTKGQCCLVVHGQRIHPLQRKHRSNVPNALRTIYVHGEILRAVRMTTGRENGPSLSHLVEISWKPNLWDA